MKQSLASLSIDERRALEERLLGRFSASKPLTPSAGDQHGQLSFAQESLWLFDQLVPNSPLYNIPQAFRIRGPFSIKHFEEACKIVALEQPALRIQIREEDKRVTQVVGSIPLDFHATDLSTNSDGASALEQALKEEAERPFDLKKEALWRVRIFSLGPQDHLVCITTHHIISDFGSLAILHRRIEQVYGRLLKGEALLPLKHDLNYSEWAASGRRRSSRQRDQILEFWGPNLKPALLPLELPVDFSRPARRSFRGARRRIDFDESLLKGLRELARAHQLTLNMILLAGWATLIYRYSGRHDFSICLPVSERNDPRCEELIGFFINIVPVAIHVAEPAPRFLEFAQQVGKRSLQSIDHAVPFSKLIEALELSGGPGDGSLPQIVFQFLPQAPSTLRLDETESAAVDMEPGTSKFDLTLTLAEDENRLRGDIEFNSDLFAPGSVDRFISHLESLLLHVAKNPTAYLDGIEILPTSEREDVLHNWNRTKTEFPRDAWVHALFEERAATAGVSPALVTDAGSLTYAEVNTRANRLAHFLSSEGIQKGSMVGVHLGRGADTIITLLAILKTGAAYVPLDPAYPPDRIAWMIQDSGVQLVISDTAPSAAGDVVETLRPAQIAGELLSMPVGNPMIDIDAESPAYIIYTSGSTGRPKGVVVPHRAIVRLVKGATYADFSQSHIFLQFAPLSFDASTLEIWGSLLNGATLAIFPAKFESLDQWGQWVEKMGVTTLWLTSGLFHQVVETQLHHLGKVRQLLAGGDILSVSHVRKCQEQLPHCEIINGYGPTENTTFSCCYSVPRNWAGGRSVPIGRPISNSTAYILDRFHKPMPVGVPGELFVGGDGLAIGYLNASDRTRDKFISNPLDEGRSRLYRTGDLARWLPDGTIEFLGRLDQQVKVNGFRIEPGEIESLITEVSGIKQASVSVRSMAGHDKMLVAHMVSDGTDHERMLRDVKNFLAARLPAFMIPNRFYFHSSLPLTANGKIDHAALEKQAARTVDPALSRTPPQTESEKKVAQVWQEILESRDIALEDNFFELGGHSLLATRVMARLNELFQGTWTISTLFEAPTLRQLAEEMNKARTEIALPGIKRRASRLAAQPT